MDRVSTLTLSASIPDAKLVAISRDLSRDLARSGIEVRTVQEATAQGERGDPVTLGVIGLALVTSGAVTVLVDCLKAYIVRERTLTVRLKRPDGSEVEISAKNVGDSELRRALGITLPPA